MKKTCGKREIGRLFLACSLCACMAMGVSVMVKPVVGQGIARADTETAPESQTRSDLDVIILDNRVYHRDRKGPVKFPHRRHAKDYEISCWDCHHVYEKGKNIYSPWGTTTPCIKCHRPLEKQDKLIKLQTAYHLSCKGCHKKLDIYKGEPRAYKKCTKCHEKKSK
ncbi:MAG: cytochrome c3 family protein [Deltaproteobacteria bacterium]|nr:cytochrome c3 family protein [Deltaproteobacteria bacterium]MBW2050271.1 cytochrome c3 family protein [Deltaproteobacteria bacterium]MBW2112539.1 cytochrome c3 family protein [Deltaproteobacteria bacterium]MBW2354728.1 cytochrome c3 family protein [Deltaproteobacteria bacterium]